MKTFLRLILTFIVFFIVNNSFSQNPIKSDTTINKRIKKNEIFKLDFQSCHSCGYRWTLDKNKDSTKLVFISIDQIKNAEHKIGGNEIETWSFQVFKKGKYQLTFIYKRPWLEAIEKKVIVNIKVK